MSVISRPVALKCLRFALLWVGGATSASTEFMDPTGWYMTFGSEGSAGHVKTHGLSVRLFVNDAPTAYPTPLSYVAEYNVNPAGNGFVTDLTACNVSGYLFGKMLLIDSTPEMTLPVTTQAVKRVWYRTRYI